MIGCNTFPTWNSWPGLFASLVTGNAVVVKPHPRAVLRWRSRSRSARRCSPRPAWTRTWSRWPRRTTVTAGQDAGHPARGEAGRLHRRHGVRHLVGGKRHPGDGLHREGGRERGGHRLHRRLQGDVRNLAFSLSLYSGQMCTTTQNLFIPGDGIETDDGHKSVDEVGAGYRRRDRTSCSATTPGRSSCSAAWSTRACSSGWRSRRVRAWWSRVAAVKHPSYPDATVRTPPGSGCSRPDAEVYERSASARWPSWSRPSAPTSRSSSSATPCSAAAR